MATSKTIATRRYLSENEIEKIDFATLTATHELWGRYLRPPLEGHAAVESFLDDIGFDHEDFARWLDNGRLVLRCFVPTDELLMMARLFVRHRHEGVEALNAALESMLSIRRIQAGAKG